MEATNALEFEYLDPARTIFEQAPDGTLRVTLEGQLCGLRVDVLRAFPLTHERDYIVVRDGCEKEIGMLRSLQEFPPEVREWLAEQLERRYFLPQVLAIHGILERFGSTIWDLDTDRGRVTVNTRQVHESVYEVEPHRFMITDAESNRYEIRDITRLDEKSRNRFMGLY
jgi:hypothetical protein